MADWLASLAERATSPGVVDAGHARGMADRLGGASPLSPLVQRLAARGGSGGEAMIAAGEMVFPESAGSDASEGAASASSPGARSVGRAVAPAARLAPSASMSDDAGRSLPVATAAPTGAAGGSKGSPASGSASSPVSAGARLPAAGDATPTAPLPGPPAVPATRAPGPPLLRGASGMPVARGLARPALASSPEAEALLERALLASSSAPAGDSASSGIDGEFAAASAPLLAAAAASAGAATSTRSPNASAPAAPAWATAEAARSGASQGGDDFSALDAPSGDFELVLPALGGGGTSTSAIPASVRDGSPAAMAPMAAMSALDGFDPAGVSASTPAPFAAGHAGAASVTATPGSSSPAQSGSDDEDLGEKVARRIQRRLMVESERRGVPRWR